MNFIANSIDISMLAFPLLISFNYFVLFYIFKIAKNQKNRTIKLFLTSLLIFVALSVILTISGFFSGYLDKIENFIPLSLISFGIPIIVIFLIIRFTLHIKTLISLVLGALYFIIYSLSAFVFFPTIGCMDSPDPNCGKSFIIAVMVIFLILYLFIFIFFYLRERMSPNSS
jgi:hypothetical protein